MIPKELMELLRAIQRDLSIIASAQNDIARCQISNEGRTQKILEILESRIAPPQDPKV